MQEWLTCYAESAYTLGMSPQDAAVADYQAVLAEIRAEMARKQISGLELAHLTGLAQSTISRRLNGAPFSVQEMLVICSALGISLRDVLEDAAKRRTASVPAMRKGGGPVVAGTGFEPATSGSRAPLSVINGSGRTAGTWTRPALRLVPAA